MLVNHRKPQKYIAWMSRLITRNLRDLRNFKSARVEMGDTDAGLLGQLSSKLGLVVFTVVKCMHAVHHACGRVWQNAGGLKMLQFFQIHWEIACPVHCFNWAHISLHAGQTVRPSRTQTGRVDLPTGDPTCCYCTGIVRKKCAKESQATLS